MIRFILFPELKDREKEKTDTGGGGAVVAFNCNASRAWAHVGGRPQMSPHDLLRSRPKRELEGYQMQIQKSENKNKVKAMRNYKKRSPFGAPYGAGASLWWSIGCDVCTNF